MKFDIGNHIRFTLPMVGVVTALLSSEGHAGTVGPVAVGAPTKMYASVFGGGGKSTSVDVAQYGAAFFSELTSWNDICI